MQLIYPCEQNPHVRAKLTTQKRLLHSNVLKMIFCERYVCKAKRRLRDSLTSPTALQSPYMYMCIQQAFTKVLQLVLGVHFYNRAYSDEHTGAQAFAQSGGSRFKYKVCIIR